MLIALPSPTIKVGQISCKLYLPRYAFKATAKPLETKIGLTYSAAANVAWLSWKHL